MRCASLAAAAAVVVVNIFPDDDDDDDDLTPKQPPRSSHKEEEEDKEIVRKQAVFKEEDKETEDLLPKREAASFREMNICVCFCVVLSCFVWVFPLGKNSILFRSFKEHLYIFDPDLDWLNSFNAKAKLATSAYIAEKTKYTIPFNFTQIRELILILRSVTSGTSRDFWKKNDDDD